MALANVYEAIDATFAIGSYTFRNISLAAPSIEGGDEINTTTTGNSTHRTKQARTLMENGNFSCTAFFEATEWDTISALVNTNSVCVLTVPGAGTLTFWGFLKTYTPQESGDGSDGWQVQCDIVVTNRNGSNVETAPIWADE